MAKYTFLPSRHAQRKKCIRASTKLSKAARSNPVIATTLEQVFHPARQRYLRARTAFRLAKADEATAQDAAREADSEFDTCFRLWVSSVRSMRGISMSRKIAALIGVLPGELVQLPYEEEVDLVDDLLEQLDRRPLLAGDPARLAALRAAHLALSEAIGVSEAAVRVRGEASEEAKAATRTFHKAWKALVRNIEDVAPHELSELPRFPVRSQQGKGRRKESEAPPTQAEGAPEEAKEPDQDEDLDELDEEFEELDEDLDEEPLPEEPPQAA